MIVRIFVAREPAKPLNDAKMCGSFLTLLGRVFKIRNFFCTIFDPINVITH